MRINNTPNWGQVRVATLLILHQSDIKATEDQFNKAANKLILALQKFYAIDEATTMVKKG